MVAVLGVAGGAVPALAAPAPISMSGLIGIQDRIEVAGTAAPREEPADYWVEYGSTTAYGKRSALQHLDAGDAVPVRFVLPGLAKGAYHLRLVGDTDPASTVTEGTVDYSVTVPGIPLNVTGLRTGADGAVVTLHADNRDVATDYWVEYGETTSYGQSTPHQTVPAGTTQDLTFTVAVVGDQHLRVAAQSYPENPADVGPDVAFSATAGSSLQQWPSCSATVTSRCVVSMTVDGAVPPRGFVPFVYEAGGGLHLDAHAPNGLQDLLYPDSPLSDSSTVSIVVNAGDMVPGMLVAAARVEALRADQTPNGTVVTFTGRPLPASFVRSGCRIGDCGDDTTRADDDQHGRVTASVFPPQSWESPATRGMWISSNASSMSTPGFDPTSGAVTVLLAAPHLTAAGAVNTGYYQSFVPTSVFSEVWKVAGPDEVSAQVSSGSVQQTASGSWTPVAGGWVLTLQDFHYSSPQIRLVRGPGNVPTNVSPVDGTAPPTAPPATPIAAPSLSLDRTVINAGERVTVTYRGTPGATLDVWSKTQPATAYSRIATVVLDANGLATTSHAPRRNTRIMATTSDGRASAQPLVQVRSVASFNVRRVGVRTLTFSGTVSPAVRGRLVSIYRNGVLVAQGPTSSAGVYSVTKVLARGTFTFGARTPNDTSNLGASSRTLRVTVY